MFQNYNFNINNQNTFNAIKNPFNNSDYNKISTSNNLNPFNNYLNNNNTLLLDKMEIHKKHMESFVGCFDYKSIELNGTTKITNYNCLEFQEVNSKNIYETSKLVSISGKDEF